MTAARKFLVAQGMWTLGIIILMLPVAILDNDPVSAASFIRWVARAVGLAAFPAGIAAASTVFADDRPWRQIAGVAAAAVGVGAVVFVLLALALPMADTTRSLAELARAMVTESEGWETRNDAAWGFYNAFVAPISAMLFAAIGVQAGCWASRFLSRPVQRTLYWMIGLGLLISGAGIWDTTYETIVLHTSADASFAVFYTLLIPGAVCAGLALPTLALLGNISVRERAG
jgi:hypothetical protein